MSAQDDVSIRRQLFRAQAGLRRQDELQADLKQTTSQLAALQAEVGRLHGALAALENSLTVRIGRHLTSALRDPRRVLLWPGIAARLVMRRLDRAVSRSANDDVAASTLAAPHVLDVDTLFADPDIALGLGGEVVALPPADDAPQSLASLRLALISDRFTADSLAMECQTLAVHPECWVEQLRDFRPHLLLVESAWRGLQGEWQGKVSEPDPALCSLVISCREAGIPTVFWNKEDPLHFEAFLRTAALFDQVYTTDAAAVTAYRQRLGHDRVHCLPFAVQPRLHHPFQQPGDIRLEGSFFAGAWYPHLQERCRDFSELADALAVAGPLVIHDRNGQGGGNNYPQRYAEMVRDAVPYEQTGSLYRRYRIGLTLNTIKHSPTMFARRAMELACTNTSVYSNYAQGLATLMGDQVRMSDDGLTVFDWAWDELHDPDAPVHRQRRLLALRKVMAAHTWRHRLETLVQRQLDLDLRQDEGEMVVLAAPKTQSELDHLLAMVRVQQVRARLAIPRAVGLEVPDCVQQLDADACAQIPGTVFPGQWFAIWHAADCYGPHYLSDLLAAARFGQGDILGKGCFPVQGAKGPVWKHVDSEYRVVDTLAWRRSMAPSARWSHTIADLIIGIDEGCFQQEGLLSTDRDSYACQTVLPDSLTVPDQGIGLAELERWVALLPNSGGQWQIAGSTLVTLFAVSTLPAGVSLSPKHGSLELVTQLGTGQTAQLVSSAIPLAWLPESEGVRHLVLRCEDASGFDLYAELLDASDNRVQMLPLPPHAHRVVDAAGPAVGIRLVLDVRGRQVSYLRALDCTVTAEPLLLPGDGRLLVVVNGYPRQGDLYRNAFVHRRVKLYQQRGVDVDVVWVCDWLPRHSYGFEGVQVQVCDAPALAATLRHSRHRAIAVHFLDPMLWSAVREAASRMRTVVWIHGAEAQPWHRRAFLYENDEDRALARAQSDQRMAFWHGIFSQRPEYLSFVFVSHTQAKEVVEDVGVALPDSAWRVIHNPIDTDLFAYTAKSAEDRFRILSIRPHASKVYANDLVAATILEMSRREGFERFSFTLVGDGPRWDEDFAGLEKFSNVSLRRGFVTQQEIKQLHDRHGVFLVPTRADTQGVSRDEAMASGLVPVTTAAGAVPEFVDEESGRVCQFDGPFTMTDAILELAGNEKTFFELSVAAANRVRSQSGSQAIVTQELNQVLHECVNTKNEKDLNENQ